IRRPVPMNKYLVLLPLLGLLSGCGAMFDNTALYDGTYRQAPQRWPDQIETCGIAKTAIVPLSIVVTATRFTRLPGYVGGCGMYQHGEIGYYITNTDFDGVDRIGVDPTGIGRDFNVYYKWVLGKDADIHLDLTNDPTWARHIPETAYESDY